MTVSLRRIDWDGVRRDLGTCFRLRNGTQEMHAYLTTHPTASWELRLEGDGELIESRTFKKDDRMLETIGEWRARLVKAGWTDRPAIEPAPKGDA